VISGLSHPNVCGGHSTENCFLTAARSPDSRADSQSGDHGAATGDGS
jgi:hypothetical protein